MSAETPTRGLEPRQQSVRVHFVDFWGNDESEEFIRRLQLFQLLEQPCGLVLDRDDPDFLIYSCFGHEHLRYSCPRIFFTAENQRPNFRECDYAFTFDYPTDSRNYRLPLYRLGRDSYPKLLTPRDPDRVMREQRGFCSFVNSNERARERIEFFDKLSQYRRVDSGGRVRNNTGGRVADKHEFTRQFKFAIAFENSSYPGYTTEKLMDALIADAIPIYWGDPLVGNDFNKRAFIDCNDFDSFDDVVEHVKRVDQDDDLYREYLSEPFFVGGVEPEFLRAENITARFQAIFEATSHPLSRRRRQLGFPIHYSRKAQRRLARSTRRMFDRIRPTR